jgi:hypothetical protein
MNRFWIFMMCCCAVGCGKRLPSAADPHRARTGLETALDAWKSGQEIDSLRKLTPAIYFNDEIWQAKKKLVKYEIQTEQANGQGWRCDVLLSVQNGGGSPTSKKVSYQIDTDPAVVIVQQP